MLTKNDLLQIKTVVQTTVRQELDSKQTRSMIRNEAKAVVEEALEEALVPVHKRLRGLKWKTTRINNTLDVLVRRTDREDTALDKRIQRVETHLHLPPLPAA